MNKSITLFMLAITLFMSLTVGVLATSKVELSRGFMEYNTNYRVMAQSISKQSLQNDPVLELRTRMRKLNAIYNARIV